MVATLKDLLHWIKPPAKPVPKRKNLKLSKAVYRQYRKSD